MCIRDRTYTVSTTIKPNETANKDYAKNSGYPDDSVGEAGTGITSAGKAGFYSNEKDSAKVTYTVNNKDGESTYPMPVVQVLDHTLKFEKRWNQDVYKRQNQRTFLKESEGSGKKERMVKVMRDDELLKKHGDIGTFIIRVQHRQNSSWQGLVTGMEENKTVSFRSALELIKIIDEVVSIDTDKEDSQSLIKD